MTSGKQAGKEPAIGRTFREKVKDGILDAKMAECASEREKIITLYRRGFAHSDIAERGWDLAEVRRIISEATVRDEGLYQKHCEGRSNK